MIKLAKNTISGIFAIANGMYTIIKHVFRPAVTLEYPEKKAEFNSRLRGRLALLVNPDGSDMCIGCKACMRACPCVDLIQIESKKDENNKMTAEKFTIDIGRCIFCGNCTEACPQNCLIMTDKYELADFSRELLVYDKKRLQLTPEESQKWRDRREKEL